MKRTFTPCRDVKTEKAQKPDWDGTLVTNHFHITLHKIKRETQRSYTCLMWK